MCFAYVVKVKGKVEDNCLNEEIFCVWYVCKGALRFFKQDAFLSVFIGIEKIKMPKNIFIWR